MRLLPPRLAGGIKGPTSDQYLVRQIAWVAQLAAVVVSTIFVGPHRRPLKMIRPPSLNHKRFQRFVKFSDGLLRPAPQKTKEAVGVGVSSLKRLDLAKEGEDFSLDFVPPDLEFVPPGLDFVPKNLDFVPGDLEIIHT